MDILVVGAGPAGLSAATVAAQAGADVTLVDSASWAGGRIALQTQPLQGPKSIFADRSGVDFCRKLINQATSVGVDIKLDTEIGSISQRTNGGFTTKFTLGETAVQSRAVVLATGSTEPMMTFPGSDLPGVMLSGDAQEMLNVHGKLPGQRIVMVGSDNAGLLISSNLKDAGANIVVVVEESARFLGRRFNIEPLQASGVPFLPSAKVLTAAGEGRLELVALRDSASEVRQFIADIMCLAGPRFPNMDVECPGEMVFDEQKALGGQVPVHNKLMATSAEGLYVCGDASGVENGAAALETGRIAGLGAALELGYAHPHAAGLMARAVGRLGYLRRGRRGSLRIQAKKSLAAEHRRVTGK